MQRLVGWPVLAALLAVTGCSAAVPAAPTPPSDRESAQPAQATSPADSPATLTIASSLVFSDDEARAAEATISFDQGGSVSATAGDGTTFELVVPPQAIAEDTLIRLTPLADVQGVGEGPVHAVRLEPEGLQFVDWPRLTITPTLPIPVANQVMFQATGAGDEVVAALVDPASEPIVILLPHFSIAGTAYAEAQGVWLAERALLPLKQLAHQVARHLQTQRARSSQGEVPDIGELGPYLDAAEKAIRGPQMTDATAMSCEATRIYMQALIGLERQRQLIGLSTEETEAAMSAEVKRAYDASFKLCERLKITECQAKPDPAILVQFWISWDRVLQMAFGDETPVGITDDLVGRAQAICREAVAFQFQRADIPIPSLGGAATDNTLDVTGTVYGCQTVDGRWSFTGTIVEQHDYGSPEYPGDLEGPGEPFTEGLLDLTGTQTPESVTLSISEFTTPEQHLEFVAQIGYDETVRISDALGAAAATITIYSGFGDRIGDFELELTRVPPQCDAAPSP